MPPSSEQDERDAQREAAPSRPAPTELRFALAVDWVSPSIARERVREWLTRLDWSPAHVDDLVIVINEAVSNSIEHGFGIHPDHPGPPNGPHPDIEVFCRVLSQAGGRRVEFTVRDQGAWQPVDPGPTHRGKGFNLMRACSDRLDVRRDAGGTTVIAVSRPVPVALRAL
ncbi:ATP-binding protein [Actinokineospora guangxiensis]|uniref:ATP-binding protein n=1 Tax=Actinokineospora guangxiensis TaxID=1490288 RepID=A0ABW0EJA8_9PSEU